MYPAGVGVFWITGATAHTVQTAGRPKGLDKAICANYLGHDAVQSRSSPARLARNRRRALRFKLCRGIRAVLHTSRNLREYVQDAAANEQATCDSAFEKYAAFLSGFLSRSSLPLATTVHNMLAADGRLASCRRQLFPLPRISVWPQAVDAEGQGEDSLLMCANVCVAALNHLEQGMPTASATAHRSEGVAVHTAVHQHICGRVVRFCSRLNDALGASFHYQGAFDKCAGKLAASGYETVRGDAVDLPKQAATCDPSTLVDPALWRSVCQADAIFPSTAAVAEDMKVAISCAPERQEYVKLTCRELRCQKLRLRLQVDGLARVFAAPKSTEGRQRKIWDGSWLSEQAMRPPKPQRLANPSSFLDILVSPGEELYMSKRDASTYFDILAVPSQLCTWFGQEPVTLSELVDIGAFNSEEVTALIDDLSKCGELTDDTLLFPVHAVWPMGFSWSSCIAQSTTIGVLMDAGISVDNILSLEHDLPASQRELCAVATDDTLLFHRCPKQGRQTLQRIDRAFERHCIPRNKAKDISLSQQMTGLGCDISSSPPLVEPAKYKQAETLLVLSDLLEHSTCSPRALSKVLGILQWFCLLQRGMFSIFDKVYAFAQREPSDSPNLLTNSVHDELFTMLALLPLLPAASDRQYLSELLACDAAPEFGFGVSALECGRKQVEKIGRLSERRGDYVRLLVEENDEPEKTRCGKPHRLAFKKSAFKTLISSKAKWQAHSGLLECHGVLLTVKWICRSRARHHRRAVILVDAKTALGSISKGRSSARALRRTLRSTAAHCLAADLLLRLVYIPSESNPADGPSRGRTRKRRQQCQGPR